MRIFQKGFNFSQDGPGNRLVIHLQGCNFRCPWCSNPEGMDYYGESYTDVTADNLFEDICRSSLLFFDGSGVTFTGGECTVQHAELLVLLQKLKKAGIHTAIETNASDPGLNELLPFVDFLIADIKHTDADIHKSVIGADNGTVLNNIGSILSQGRQLLLRIPLINGFNTDPKPFIEFLTQYPKDNLTVEVLPYHEYGKSKWKTEYKMKDGFVSDEVLNSFKSELARAGIKIIST